MRKYVVMDGESCGWYTEAWTLKEIASKIASAKDYVVAFEDGKLRELTPEEQAQLQYFRKPIRDRWFG
jgi:hypothetical protein